MRKFALFALLLLILPTAVFAQERDRDEDWRRRRAYDDAPRRDAFELTPFLGFRWGGTVYSSDVFGGFNDELQVAASPSFGADLAIPLGGSGMKVTLMANHQSSELESGGGLFEPDEEFGDFDVTYFHGGLQIPFGGSRNAVPYGVVSAGVARLDPHISGVTAETRFSASGGFGIKLPMNRNAAIRIEGRGYYTSLEEATDCSFCDVFVDENFYQGEVNIGFTFGF